MSPPSVRNGATEVTFVGEDRGNGGDLRRFGAIGAIYLCKFSADMGLVLLSVLGRTPES